jgi:HisJ family histidinol phosphate phosphatase
MVSDHMNYLTFEDPAAINLVRRALKLAQAGDLYGAAETASVEVGHAAVVSEGLRRGMRYSIGAEVDNDPRSRPDAQNIVDAMKPDGMIRSVHFLTIDHPTHGPAWNWPFDNPEFVDVFELVGTARTWELYMATLLDAVERLPGHIVGHFYVPATFGHWPDAATLEAYEDQIVDACEARGLAIEFNTRFLYRDHSDEEKAAYLAANRRLLTKCKAKNVGIAIGSDAHSPKDQGRGFETVLALLDECEINELVFPISGRLARVALRVERKAEPPADPPTAASDDRKAARRAQPTESVAAIREDVLPATDEADASTVKPKARPKRARAKVATSVSGEHLDAPERIDIDEREPEDVAPTVESFDRADEPPTVLDGAPTELAGAPAEHAPTPAELDGEPADTSAAGVDADVSVDADTPATLVDETPVSPAPIEKPRSAPAKARAASGAKKSAKPAVKAAAKKAPAKGAAAKKSGIKKATSVKKAAPKKASAKKAPAKKAAIRTTVAKKTTAKKSVAKKAAAKKPQRRR